ncbi:hypothetical protein MTsDn1_08090 [Alteromonas sp. MTD1]
MSTSAATSVGAKRMQSRSERKRISAKTKEAEVQNAQDADAESNSKQSKDNAFANKKNVMWVLLSGAMALTFIVMLFLPNTGMGNGMIATYSAMLWCGFFGASLWRYRSSNGWTGFAYGSVIGFTLQFVSQLI